MGDTSAPLTGMSINPDGSIAYDFAGHISATGLDLPEETGGKGLPSKIRWLDSTDVERLSLVGERITQPPLGARHRLFVEAPPERRVLLGHDGGSAFLQLPETMQNHLEALRRVVDFGAVQLPYFGGFVGAEEWPVTDEVIVPHALETIPRAVIAVTEDRVWCVGVKEKTAFDFTLWAATHYYEIAEDFYTAYWIAIG